MLVMLINAVGYGTIIPLMYPFASKFGMNATGMSFLFVSFSIAQFFSTPILGRLSDKYGRKVILSLCLLGSGLSFFIFASAKTVLFLFLARILDGITGGNVSVAQAVVADETKPAERAKVFGFLGASFGFGFVFGPALGGFLSKISITTPFMFAGLVSMFATIACIFFLKETNTHRETKLNFGKLFDPKNLIRALFTPVVGIVLAVSFISLIAQNAMIIGFQGYTNDVLKLDPIHIAILFSSFGVVNIFMQAFGVRLIIKKVKDEKKITIVSFLVSSIIMFMVFITSGFLGFTVFMLLYGVALSPTGIVLTTMVSERTKAEDQGGIMGINQAYNSLSQIIGPLIAGVIAVYSEKSIFAFTAFVLLISAVIALRIPKVSKKLDL